MFNVPPPDKLGHFDTAVAREEEEHARNWRKIPANATSVSSTMDSHSAAIDPRERHDPALESHMTHHKNKGTIAQVDLGRSQQHQNMEMVCTFQYITNKPNRYLSMIPPNLNT